MQKTDANKTPKSFHREDIISLAFYYTKKSLKGAKTPTTGLKFSKNWQHVWGKVRLTLLTRQSAAMN
jgi:hypothetical protein